MNAAKVAILAVLLANTAMAQLKFERPPIDYNNGPLDNPITRLQKKMDEDSLKLDYDETHGYLPSLLKELDVSISSQVMVFSKTSLQIRHIEPKQPRAIYFNDDVYIGNTKHGAVYEISAVDPRQGGIFYTLDLQRSEKPQFIRDKGQCLTCHASSRTAGVPGHLVRSVFPDRKGHPIIGSGTFTTDHTSPFSKRWGGWYVTGTHGTMRHLGNVFANTRRNTEKPDMERGANITDLSDLVDMSPYLTPHSDLVALMVLEHQTQMQNLIARASFETRVAIDSDRVMNEMLDRDADHRSDSTKRRINRVADQLLQWLFFSDEFQLTSPVKGTSPFAQEFAARGPRDKQGRSLRDLDLQTRIMKYPCSYLIYSPPFDKLPLAVKEIVYRRLFEILEGNDKSGDFDHLTESDRVAILEILAETKPELSEYRG